MFYGILEAGKEALEPAPAACILSLRLRVYVESLYCVDIFKVGVDFCVACGADAPI